MGLRCVMPCRSMRASIGSRPRATRCCSPAERSERRGDFGGHVGRDAAREAGSGGAAGGVAAGWRGPSIQATLPRVERRDRTHETAPQRALFLAQLPAPAHGLRRGFRLRPGPAAVCRLRLRQRHLFGGGIDHRAEIELAQGGAVRGSGIVGRLAGSSSRGSNITNAPGLRMRPAMARPRRRRRNRGRRAPARQWPNRYPGRTRSAEFGASPPGRAADRRSMKNGVP